MLAHNYSRSMENAARKWVTIRSLINKLINQKTIKNIKNGAQIVLAQKLV
jgi:hypothetical protein